MEIVWYRMLSPLLGGTTFTFGLILPLLTAPGVWRGVVVLRAALGLAALLLTPR